MAETLGSLIDKLAIKNLREYHLREINKGKNKKFSSREIKEKLNMLLGQKSQLIQEIEGFIVGAIKGKVLLKDDKLKLYNPVETIGRIPSFNKLGEAISYLVRKNAQLWCLEDEARRHDVSLSYIGKTKKKIDLANQQRNDAVDKVDALFESMIKKHKR